VYQTEKQIKEFEEKLPAELKTTLEAKLGELRDAISADDVDKMKAGMETLQQEVRFGCWGCWGPVDCWGCSATVPRLPPPPLLCGPGALGESSRPGSDATAVAPADLRPCPSRAQVMKIGQAMYGQGQPGQPADGAAGGAGAGAGPSSGKPGDDNVIDAEFTDKN
jgi:hypothetical protein